MKSWLKSTFLLFALFGVIFIPAASFLVDFQNGLATTSFGGLVSLFGIEDVSFSSDTTGLYLLIPILFVLALMFSVVLNRLEKWKLYQEKVFALIRLTLVFYLASRLMVYGFDKIFKSQFYLPEPNTLYTPFGQMTKDILFWSTMGTSKLFSTLTGVFEVIPALFLCFRKTRTFGLFLIAFILVNVLFINFGFDISVKLYSLFLLFLCLLLLSPNLKNIFLFFTGKPAELNVEVETFAFLKQPFVKNSLKTAVIGMILLEATFFAVSTSNFNDDSAKRPYLHGAYELVDKDFGTQNIYERFYIHRRGFIIFETRGGDFIDYKLEIDSENGYFSLWDYDNYVNHVEYKLFEGESKISLQWPSNSDNQILIYEALDWRSLPALEDEFHWTIESY